MAFLEEYNKKRAKLQKVNKGDETIVEESTLHSKSLNS